MPWAPRRVPLEPLFKVLLTFIGINGELWFGHESWRWACAWLQFLLLFSLAHIRIMRFAVSSCTATLWMLSAVAALLLCFQQTPAAGRVRRSLYGEDGRFIVGNINEWQHSAMYVAFLLSGAVDLVGFYMPPGTLPVGTEQARAVPL